MIKKDIDCITNPDNTISEVLQYFIASIVLLALSPLILIFALIGMFIMNPYLTFFNITYEESETIPIYRIFYITFIK